MKPAKFALKTVFLFSSLIIVACGGGGGGPEPVAPVVTAQSPADGDTDVPTNSVLSVTFDKAVAPATLTSATFTLAGSSSVTGVISYDAATFTATFTPDAPLQPGVVYTATLTTGVTDTNGTALAGVYSASFTTEAFILRASVDSAEAEASQHSYDTFISADGRYVAFASDADDLVADDNNGVTDVFVRDTRSGTTTRVSVKSDGTEASGDSYNPSISTNGRYVAFSSDASDLVTGDDNGVSDIFVHDRQTGATPRVSVDSMGAQADDASEEPVISANGRYVVFSSDAANLLGAGNDTNGAVDIFMHDLVNGTTSRVSVTVDGMEANGFSFSPRISDDGRYIAFQSDATNLVAQADNNAAIDIFVRDTVAAITTRVSVDSDEIEADNNSFDTAISADGHYVVFSSAASNLAVENDTNDKLDIFLRDTLNGTTTRVSVNSDEVQANGPSLYPSISADGRYVAFSSAATNLVAVDDNGVDDIFIRDNVTGTTYRVNLDASGAQANAASGEPLITADGRYVGFSSDATNLLVSGDSNSASDVFRVVNTSP